MANLYYETSLAHSGKGHDKGGHSGRYPWGSGERPFQSLKSSVRKTLMSKSDKSSKMPKDDTGNIDYDKAKEEIRRANLEKEYTKKVLEETSPQEQIGQVKNSANSIIDSAKRVNNIVAKSKNTQSQDLSKMSDAELKAKVSRLNLERQYAQLTQPELDSGHQKVNDILDVGGSVVAAAAGAATLALTLKKLLGH